MAGSVHVDTTSEQERLEVLNFRISLYKVAEMVMNLGAFILAMGGLISFMSGLGGAILLIGLIGLLLIVTGYFTRLTRRMAESEVEAIKIAIDKVTGF
jgi:Zn-dependent membrane protease YugP